MYRLVFQRGPKHKQKYKNENSIQGNPRHKEALQGLAYSLPTGSPHNVHSIQTNNTFLISTFPFLCLYSTHVNSAYAKTVSERKRTRCIIRNRSSWVGRWLSTDALKRWKEVIDLTEQGKLTGQVELLKCMTAKFYLNLGNTLTKNSC